MRRSGYWIECVPSGASERIYTASVDVFPDLVIQASSPDAAVDRMRWKLLSLRRNYSETGQLLPRPHSPHTPPTQRRGIEGWLSVYIELES